MNEKPKYSQRIVLSSSHVDKHGCVMTKEALESALKFINGNRKPRLGLDHNKNFPPMGRINNGEVIKGEDGAYYLIGYQEYFDTVETLTLNNGLELIRESFSSENFPFAECDFEQKEKVEISYDPVNLGSYDKGKEFIKELSLDNEFEFEGAEFMRKAEIPDPEIVIRITEILTIAIGLGLRKIPEKIGEAIGEDLAKFYKLLSKTIKKSTKELIPKNRPIHFVVEVPIDKTLVEFIVTTRNPDLAISAFQPEFLKDLKKDIDVSIKSLKAEKIQFHLNQENNNTWEINYILTKEGKVIGTKKSFKKRDDFFQEMVQKQIKKKKKN